MDRKPGKIYLIAGAAGGLGGALARLLARQLQPVQLVLLDRNRQALEQLADAIEARTGVAAWLYPMDLGGAAPEDYARLAETLEKQCGGLDGVLFCAAQFEGLRPQRQTGAREWLIELQANLGGSQMLMLHLLPMLLQSECGRAVFVIHDLEQVSRAYWGAYGVAQHGMAALASQWADELGNTTIRVLHCEPGPMRTRLRSRVWPSVRPTEWPEPEQAAQAIVDWLKAPQSDTGIHRMNLTEKLSNHV